MTEKSAPYGMTGERILAIRTGLKLSQEDFALKIRASARSVRRWEANQGVPAVRVAAAILALAPKPGPA